jgi:type I restriction enzyme S subunit
MRNIIIPIPSLEEQTRIVGILDTFTSAIDNLKEQIAQRRKQYEYYRDQLLDLEGKEGVEMIKLGDICFIKNGYTPSTKNPEFWEGGSLPWFTLDDIRKNGRILTDAIKHITATGVKKSGLFPKESIIISTTATIGEFALINTDFLCNQQITSLSIKAIYKDQLLAKFLYYLSDGIGKWCKKNVNGGGSLLIVSTSKLNNYVIPVPSLSEQSRIVSILDTFEASIQNLEAQLKEREKQYEYYRNKLLTFE